MSASLQPRNTDAMKDSKGRAKALKRLTRKVVVYCVRQGRLLVLRHLDHAADEVGLQVPAGSIRDGEDRAVAALRELEEEAGRTGFTINAYLGQAFYDISPYRNEVQERFFFLASAPSNIGERWTGTEDHDGNALPTRFEFFWIPLAHGHVLQSGQGALLGSITAEMTLPGLRSTMSRDPAGPPYEAC